MFCDGIREPVSGSFLYGNNISAPRSFLFGREKRLHFDQFILMQAAPSLGRGVTVPAENSMLGKTLREDGIHSLPGCELSYLRLKLYCLKTFLDQNNERLAQLERTVSFQLVVGYNIHYGVKSVLIMCTDFGRYPTSVLMKDQTTNGKSKGNLLVLLFIVNQLKRTKKTLGSSVELARKALTCLDISADDGDFVLPEHVLGRKSEIAEKSIKNTTRMGVPPEDDEEPNNSPVKQIKKNWVKNLKTSKGVEVPKKFFKLIEVCKLKPNCKVKDLYPLLLDSTMYDMAYNLIQSKPGNMTKGADGSTLDDWGAESISRIINSLQDESFQFSQSRLIEVPNPQEGVRPIKIGSPKDKIVQRIITNILEAIYEPSFSKHSFGFRPGLGCHNALKFVHQKFQASRWFIEGDISKCFDEIDHDFLISVLRRRISDQRFIRLIYKALKAGFIDTHKVSQNCILGTPQGSIVSPILCNIFMDQFDQFISEKLMPKFNLGLKRAQPLEYTRLMARARYFSKKYKKTKDPENLNKCLELRKKGQNLPSVDPKDSNFRRLYYVRYADEFLIGLAGSMKEAEYLRNECKQFLSDLKLRLSEEKTLITSASQGCIFLGTKIHVPLNEERFKQKGVRHKSRANLGVRLNAPLTRVIKKLNSAGYCDVEGKAKPRFALFAASPDEIVKSYSSVLRGYLNYYSFADNYNRLGASLFHILRGSVTKLLATKLKLKTSRQVLLKYGKHLERLGKYPLTDYKTESARGDYFKLGDNSPNTKITALYSKASNTIRSEALSCAVCSSTLNVEMHHQRQLKDLNRKMDPISRARSARQRKQIPWCPKCHMDQPKIINRIAKGK